MSSTQSVTSSDNAHPPVALKLSEQEQKRVQQADGKLQDYMQSQVVLQASKTCVSKLLSPYGEF